MAEEIKKPTKNDNVINFRLVDKTSDEVAEFAKEVYGFRATSEFMRYALDYIMEHKPVLGKDFVPESASS